MFVEEGDPKAKLETFKWHQEFTKDQDRLELVFNDPIKDPEAQVFAQRIKARKDMTLRELKEAIGEIVSLKPSEFVVKRYSASREYKNMESKLYELGLTNGNLLKIELGSPHQDGVYEVNIHQVIIKSHKSPTSVPSESV